MKKRTVIALILITLLLLTGCFGSKKKKNPEVGTINGIVKDKITGRPISGVSIIVGKHSSKTGSDGKYSISQVKAGTRQLKTTKKGYGQYTTKVDIKDKGDLIHNIKLVSVKDGSLEGQVTRKKTEELLTGVRLIIGDQEVITDEKGYYRIDNIPAGSYQLKGIKTNYRLFSRKVEIKPGQLQQCNLQMLDSTGIVKGYVSDTRGGPPVAGSKVSALSSKEIITDENGYFELEVPANKHFDLTITKEGRGTARIQDILVKEDQVLEYEIPTRELVSSGKSTIAPYITLDGIQEGQQVSGTISVNISISGESSARIFYVYLGGKQQSPAEAVIENTNSSTVKIDTTPFPDGASYLRILVYDQNNNVTLTLVPLIINNGFQYESPDDLNYLELISYTFTESLGTYQINNKLDSHLESLPPASTLYTELKWDSIPTADGYSVYRSFDGESYQHIGDLADTFFLDYSAQLTVEEKVYYKVEPYNSFGRGKPLVRSVTPLAPYQLYLEEPGNQSIDISLAPIFRWRNEVDGIHPPDTVYLNHLVLTDEVGYKLWQMDGEYSQLLEEEYPEFVEPGLTYRWDITEGQASCLYEEDTHGFSKAIAYAGSGSGASNGPYSFTTTKDAVQTLFLEEYIDSDIGRVEIPITITQEAICEFITSFYKHNCDTKLDLYDKDTGDLIVFNDDDDRDNDNYRYSYMSKYLEPGEYVLVVTGYAGGSLWCYLEIYTYSK